MNASKRVLVLGAGLVTRPMVSYLLEQPDIRLTVATRTVDKAQRMIAGHARGKAVALDVADEAALDAIVAEHDLIVSLLPYIHHVKVAKLCLAHRRHLVTTSYVSAEMRELDGAAREAGVLLLNEIGLDPGIDHMSAMRIINGVAARGGQVTGFISNCGGLPAPEANTNPWGYKFSWSPRGVVLAGRNAARYLWEGDLRQVPGPDLFGDMHHLTVEGLGQLEVYPNRDSLGYREIYGLHQARTLFRGTFRYPGHCATWKALADCGWLDLNALPVEGMSYGKLFCTLVGCEGRKPAETAARFLDLAPDAEPLRRFEWLGLFSDEPIPGPAEQSPLDVLAERLLLKLPYASGERDMIVLQHRVTAEHPGGETEKIVSSLIDFGQPGGDSAMSRTVSLPAAIAVRRILDGTIRETGVLVPVLPAVYDPVLDELATLGIAFEETVSR